MVTRFPAVEKYSWPKFPDRPFTISPYLQWVSWAVYPMVEQPGHEADCSDLVAKMSGAEPPIAHMPHVVVLQLSTWDDAVLRIEIFKTVIIKNVFPNMASFRSLLLFPR